MECSHSFLRLFCTNFARVPGFSVPGTREPGWVPGSWERNPKLTPLISAAPLGLKCGTHKSLSLDEIRMLSESAVYEKRGFRSPTSCLRCYVFIIKVVCNGDSL
jgi:hypothetical protein